MMIIRVMMTIAMIMMWSKRFEIRRRSRRKRTKEGREEYLKERHYIKILVNMTFTNLLFTHFS